MVRANNRIFLAAILLLALAFAFKDRLTRPPRLDPAPAAGQFDAPRAFARLSRILAGEGAHGVDSAANDRVRGRIAAELRAIGLTPQLRDSVHCQSYPHGRGVRCARIRNLTATIGPAGGRHLLLATHYDSSIAGPGASDAGMGVATLLEVGALLRGERLARPVTLLFDEGEEAGLLGAAAFLANDPLAARVDALINLEARGVTGPAIMFETSQPNGGAIAAYAGAAPRPVANSLTTDFYGLIPNSTDVDIFRPRGWTTLNFAVIGNETRYHSPGDDLAALDQRSLQHMGMQVLASARALGMGVPAAQGQRLYADLLGRHLVVLPQVAGLALLGLLALAFAWLCWRRHALGRPLAAMAVAILGGALLAWAGEAALALLRGGEYWRAYPLALHMAVYAGTLLACLVALLWVAGRAGRPALRASFWAMFLLIGAGIACLAPGAAIFFLAPPLVALIGTACGRWFAPAERIGALAAAALLLLTLLPILALVEMLLVAGPAFMLSPLAALLMLPVLIEARPEADMPRRALALFALGLLAAGWLVTALVPAYSADRQQRFAVEYAWNAETKSAQWGVYNDGKALPAAFTALGDWRRGALPHARAQRWLAAAPALPVPPPAVTVLAETRRDGQRHLRIRLAANGADAVQLIARRQGTLAAAGTAGHAQPLGKAWNAQDLDTLSCQGRGCDGALFDLVLDGAQPAMFDLVGMRFGLPATAAPLVQARPPDARPQYTPDATYAVGAVRL